METEFNTEGLRNDYLLDIYLNTVPCDPCPCGCGHKWKYILKSADVDCHLAKMVPVEVEGKWRIA